MSNQPPCVTWAEKLALRHEDLSPGDRDALEAHVRGCPACEATQADYRLLDARLRALPPPSMQPLPRLFPALTAREERAGQHMGSEEGPTPRTSLRGDSYILRPDGRRHSPSRAINKLLTVALVATLVLAIFALFGSRYVDTSVGRPLGTTLYTYQGHTNFVDALAWSPDGRYVASGSWDHTVQVWDAKTRAQILSYPHNDIVDALAWSPNSRYLASGSWDHTVQVWDVSTDTLLINYHGHSDFVDALAWSPDGRYIASGSWDHTVRVWNVYTGALVYKTQIQDFVDALAWSPDGRYIAIGGRDEAVYVLDAGTGTVKFTFTGENSVVNTVAWSPKGPYVAAGYRDGTVQIWNATTGILLHAYKIHDNEVRSLAWSPDGRYIASGSWDHTVRVWNVKTGIPLVIYRGHTGNVDAVAWSPDGRYVASGSWDDTVQVWQATYGGKASLGDEGVMRSPLLAP